MLTFPFGMTPAVLLHSVISFSPTEPCPPPADYLDSFIFTVPPHCILLKRPPRTRSLKTLLSAPFFPPTMAWEIQVGHQEKPFDQAGTAFPDQVEHRFAGSFQDWSKQGHGWPNPVLVKVPLRAWGWDRMAPDVLPSSSSSPAQNNLCSNSFLKSLPPSTVSGCNVLGVRRNHFPKTWLWIFLIVSSEKFPWHLVGHQKPWRGGGREGSIHAFPLMDSYTVVYWSNRWC